MSSIIRMLASFLGVFFKEMFPALMTEFRKPTQTRYVGDDDELDAAVDASIQEQAMKDLGFDLPSDTDEGSNDGED